MISIMKSVLGSSVTCQDQMLYATAMGLNHSISSEKNMKTRAIAIETLDKLLCETETRYLGLHMLEITLLQNPQNFNRKRFLVVIFNYIKDPKLCTLEKQLTCRILALIIPYMKSGDPVYESSLEDLSKYILPFLLTKVSENVEWAQAACTCIKIYFQSFPTHLVYHQKYLLDVVLDQASNCVSSELFEVVAECFALLPNNGVGTYQERWKNLYDRTLKTVQRFLIESLRKEAFTPVSINGDEFYVDEKESKSFLPNFERTVRRFTNFCRCLSKLLSVKSKGPIKPPITLTLKILLQLFSVCRKDSVIATQNEVLYSFIAQMRLGGLVVLESLILNCNLIEHTRLLTDIIKAAVENSYSNFTYELISELRIGVWKVLTIWLDGYPFFASKAIVEQEGKINIIEELLSDTSIASKESTQVENSSTSNNTYSIPNKHDEEKCCAALDSLNSLLVAGMRRMSQETFKKICNHIFSICESIDFSREMLPSPYDKESCREKLYTVVLTIIENVKTDDYDTIKTAMNTICFMNHDSSYKVRNIQFKATSKYRLQFYSTREIPLFLYERKRKRNENRTNSSWHPPSYAVNLPSEAETSDNITIKTEPTSENEVEVHAEEYMETNYTEHVVENCNEEIEIRSSSQFHDEVDSDEDDEEDDDDEEEEDEERSYADEEMNQEEHRQEMYIPVTREIPTPSSPVQISTEIVLSTDEPEYEELAPCVKIEESTVNSVANKDKVVNGERIVHDENLPSSSTQKTNENGIFGIDDDDLDEENDEDDDDVENCDSAGETREQPPSKRQKVETKDDSEDDNRNEREKSPTLDEMKADFLELLPSIEDVKSGKVQLSSP